MPVYLPPLPWFLPLRTLPVTHELPLTERAFLGRLVVNIPTLPALISEPFLTRCVPTTVTFGRLLPVAYAVSSMTTTVLPLALHLRYLDAATYLVGSDPLLPFWLHIPFPRPAFVVQLHPAFRFWTLPLCLTAVFCRY